MVIGFPKSNFAAFELRLLFYKYFEGNAISHSPVILPATKNVKRLSLVYSFNVYLKKNMGAYVVVGARLLKKRTINVSHFGKQ